MLQHHGGMGKVGDGDGGDGGGGVVAAAVSCMGRSEGGRVWKH